MASGQWRDPATGLIWMRCSIGQKWENKTCKGDPVLVDYYAGKDNPALIEKQFNQSGFAGYKDWSVPTISQLATIRVCSKGWGYKYSSEGVKTSELEKILLPDGSVVNNYCSDESDNYIALDSKKFPNTTKVNQSQLMYLSSTFNVVAGLQGTYTYWGVMFETDGGIREYMPMSGLVRLVRQSK